MFRIVAQVLRGYVALGTEVKRLSFRNRRLNPLLPFASLTGPVLCSLRNKALREIRETIIFLSI